MIIWILYDIVNDRTRGVVAKYCKKSGLYRVQYSCFLGTLTEDAKDSLALQIEEIIDSETDKIYIFSMSKSELKQAVCLGIALDKKLVTDDVKALFL